MTAFLNSRIPPGRLPDWASTGTKTDPGTSKEAAGWLVDERPPAFWWNWLLGTNGDWLSFFRDTMAPYIAHWNKTNFSGTPPLENDATRHIGTYSSVFNRWYISEKASNTDLVCFDTNEPWDVTGGVSGWEGQGTTVEATVTSISPIFDDGTNLFVASDATLYRSTTGLVANFASYDTLDAAMTSDEMVYDKVNSKFLYGAAGTIYHSSNGTTWSTYTTPANNISQVAHRPSDGRTSFIEDTTNTVYVTDNGGTSFSSGTLWQADYFWYSQALGRFCAKRNSDGKLYSSSSGNHLNWSSFSDITVDAIIDTPEFLLIEDVTSTPKHWWALRAGGGTSAVANVLDLGHSGTAETDNTGMRAAQKSMSRGGGNVFYFRNNLNSGGHAPSHSVW